MTALRLILNNTSKIKISRIKQNYKGIIANILFVKYPRLLKIIIGICLLVLAQGMGHNITAETVGHNIIGEIMDHYITPEAKNPQDPTVKVINDYAEEDISFEELELLLENVNNITDPEERIRVQRLINDIAIRYNIDINVILQPHLQHNIVGHRGNSGNLTETLNFHRTWEIVRDAMLIAAGITLTVYLIMRHWDSIRDLLCDMATHIDLSGLPISQEVLIRLTAYLLNNPSTRYAFANALRIHFQMIRGE
jgi:hypothetical protein